MMFGVVLGSAPRVPRLSICSCVGCNSGWKPQRGDGPEICSIRASESTRGLPRRGRLDRVLAKYQDSTLIAQAESALQRALELDPDSGPAHYYRAQLEIDTGRPHEALMRLPQT